MQGSSDDTHPEGTMMDSPLDVIDDITALIGRPLDDNERWLVDISIDRQGSAEALLLLLHAAADKAAART
ncbi:hypothetical protein [Nonomuraea salmonea]|uniref:Uncharacterized protein n=1 Tax=Nonomuraea salmonea TaxID=46181 RepID=A0ABV5P3A1_9ACTN